MRGRGAGGGIVASLMLSLTGCGSDSGQAQTSSVLVWDCYRGCQTAAGSTIQYRDQGAPLRYENNSQAIAASQCAQQHQGEACGALGSVVKCQCVTPVGPDYLPSPELAPPGNAQFEYGGQVEALLGDTTGCGATTEWRLTGPLTLTFQQFSDGSITPNLNGARLSATVTGQTTACDTLNCLPRTVQEVLQGGITGKATAIVATLGGPGMKLTFSGTEGASAIGGKLTGSIDILEQSATCTETTSLAVSTQLDLNLISTNPVTTRLTTSPSGR